MIDVLNMEEFGARLVSYQVAPTPVTNEYLEGYKTLMAPLMDTDISKREIVIILHLKGSTPTEIANNENKLFSAIYKESELLLPDGYQYSCIFREGSSESISQSLTEIEITLVGVRHLGLVVVPCINVNTEINCSSTVDTPCIIRITPEMPLESITVYGITISNVSDTVIIDGIKKKITMSSDNKFADTDLTEFPSLHPGVNNIWVSDISSAIITVEYYPTFI